MPLNLPSVNIFIALIAERRRDRVDKQHLLIIDIFIRDPSFSFESPRAASAHDPESAFVNRKAGTLPPQCGVHTAFVNRKARGITDSYLEAALCSV